MQHSPVKSKCQQETHWHHDFGGSPVSRRGPRTCEQAELLHSRRKRAPHQRFLYFPLSQTPPPEEMTAWMSSAHLSVKRHKDMIPKQKDQLFSYHSGTYNVLGMWNWVHVYLCFYIGFFEIPVRTYAQIQGNSKYSFHKPQHHTFLSLLWLTAVLLPNSSPILKLLMTYTSSCIIPDSSNLEI